MTILHKKGFSLLELILVLGVGAMISFIKFQDMRTEQEQVLANAVGQQIKQVGEAVNGYINIRYDKIALYYLMLLEMVLIRDQEIVIQLLLFVQLLIRH